MTWARKTGVRWTGIVAVAVLLTMTGCAPAPTPQCSDAIADVWAPDGSTRIDRFPAPHLLDDLHPTCFVAVEMSFSGSIGRYGEAIVEGTGSEKRIVDALKSRGYTRDDATDSWVLNGLNASVSKERKITADDGVPELTGKTVAVLYVGKPAA